MDHKKKKYLLIALIYVAFISLGLPDGLLGVAWPEMRDSFSLPLDALGIILIGSTTGYLLSSFFNGFFMRKIGVAVLLALSCLATALALIGYTLVPVWWLLPLLAVLAGLGAGAIDAGLNTYVEKNFNEGLMQWLHASFGVGVTIGPIIMSSAIKYFDSWRVGYLIVGSAQILLALTFALTLSLWQDPKKASKAAEQSNKKRGKNKQQEIKMFETLKYFPALLSVLLFFIYTGIELTLGHWTFTLFTESRGIRTSIAGIWVSVYWGSFTVGRILAGFLAYKFLSRKIAKNAAFLGLFGSALIAINLSKWLSLLGLALTGIAIAPIFPALISSTSYRVGKGHTVNTIGMQISAAGLGGALLPGLAGVLANNISLEIIPVFIIILFITFLLINNLITKLSSQAAKNAA
ncbi:MULTISPECIES: MFS transporter [Halanaerobium]|uniref:Fucose permease n=1 Tax=Halanaerobium saccharolyticum TaxID=43595 RepID=A0A2T5RIJ2_9FIRM|nr:MULTISPECIES: MFS transporter [Halanaerobium]KXS50404.1 MAG: major facilitator superfamily protein [Halanaerobium sp. T82-1]PTV98112.1 fucose permease [Halanaerobium saccharolyticum]PUU95752.1 MAG: major facilitator superfamily protein [Halanaerobium sp.]RCW62318.1 fucose permease [Halanaerobium sp. ST460_2HS_T2]